MRSVVVCFVGSLILGLVASTPATALPDPQVSAGGSVSVFGVPGENFGPDGGMVSISTNMRSAHRPRRATAYSAHRPLWNSRVPPGDSPDASPPQAPPPTLRTTSHSTPLASPASQDSRR